MAQGDETDSTSEPLHLAVVGGGIAGSAAATWAAGEGTRVTLFNTGLPLGGTCLHVGAFPARTLMSAATDYDRARHPRFEGLTTGAEPPDLAALNRARRQTGDRIRRHQYEQLQQLPNVEIVDERAAFLDERTLRAGGERYRPDRILLTPGSRSLWPDIEGLDEISAMGMEDLADLRALPESIVFVEYNDVALAYAQLLARFGSRVTIVTEDGVILDESYGDASVRDAMTDLLVDEGLDLVTDADLDRVASTSSGVRLRGRARGGSLDLEADRLAIIDHHRPRTEDLELDRADVALTDEGFIVVDEALQTTNDAVYAAGDAVGRGGHAYSAAYDATLAARNAISPSRTAGHTTAVPFAIYTDPELAGVGWSASRAREAGFRTDSAICSLENLPAGEAIGHAGGFVKLIRDRRSDHLVGARLLTPHASELVMQLAVALRYGTTVSELATMVHPPISLGEAVGRAARRFSEQRPRPAGTAPSPPGGQ